MVPGGTCARAQTRPISRLGPALFLALTMCISSAAPAAVQPLPAALQENQPGPGIERLAARVQQRLREVADLEARFVQRRLTRFGSVIVEREGKLYIRPPGRMRWEYDQPPDVFCILPARGICSGTSISKRRIGDPSWLPAISNCICGHARRVLLSHYWCSRSSR